MAILRYVARIGGIQGDSDADFALSEMLIEESVDIGSGFDKAYRAEDKAAAFDALFAPEGDFAKHLGYLEKMHPEGTPFFFAEKRLAGGIALAAVLDFMAGVEPTCLDAFPKMKAFREAMISLPAFDGIRDYPVHVKRTA